MATVKYVNKNPDNIVEKLKCSIPKDLVTTALKLGYVAVRMCRVESTKSSFIADGIVTPTIKYNKTNTVYTTDIIE